MLETVNFTTYCLNTDMLLRKKKKKKKTSATLVTVSVDCLSYLSLVNF